MIISSDFSIHSILPVTASFLYPFNPSIPKKELPELKYTSIPLSIPYSSNLPKTWIFIFSGKFGINALDYLKKPMQLSIFLLP